MVATAKARLFPSLVIAVGLMLACIPIFAGRGFLLAYQGEDLPYFVAIDSEAYVKMATGHVAEVELPFTKRFAYPFFAGSIARTLSVPLPYSFLFLSLFSVGVMGFAVARLFDELTGRPLLALIPLATAFVFNGAALAYLPDLFHAAFTAVFFLLLWQKRTWTALALLLVLCVVRDNTFLLCVCLSALAWREGKRQLAIGSAVVLILGVLITSRFAKLGLPNVHHMPDAIYLLLKVPYNLLYNVGGICVWTDARPSLGQPLVSWSIPKIFHHLGSDRQIGLLAVWHEPFRTFIVLGTIFGTLPIFLPKLLRSWSALTSLPLVLKVALVYGLVSYVIGPGLGNWTTRLVGYGWPAFWLVIPYLLWRERITISRGRWLAAGVCFYLLNWLPNRAMVEPCWWVTIPVAIVVLYALFYLALGRQIVWGKFSERPVA